jgi:PAS domain S-box-containing protein
VFEQRWELPSSVKVRAALLDLEAWTDILTSYSRTMGVAVALTDVEGQILGQCHNAQPVWTLVHEAVADWGGACPFCVTSAGPCTAVADALRTGSTVLTRDLAGLAHVAVPLLLDGQPLGAIVAGQVFDRYPDPLSLRRVAKDLGVPAEPLWDMARKQRPVSAAVLRSSGDLLQSLGHAFLQQRLVALLEADLAQTNARFRLLVEGVKDYALFTVDAAGRVTTWNSGAERLLGYARAQIKGQPFARFFTAEDIHHRVPEQQLQSAGRAGRMEDEGWRVRADGTQFLAHVNITATAAGVDRSADFAILVQDVTEQRKHAVILEEAQRERHRLQEQFLSHVSHELRTPLTAIYFFTTNVLDGLVGDVTAEQRQHLTFVLENVQQLKNMVSDLLDLTRVDTAKVTLDWQHANPANLIAEVFSACRTNAAAKDIRLRIAVAPGLPFLWADPVRVRQILTNLIDNGVKFTPAGGVVTVTNEPYLEGDVCLSLSVSDTGCGIGLADRQVIFERLAQAAVTTEASRTGLGLGLFIAREMVTRHGGRIWLESEVGQGSTFHFTLPVFSLAKHCAHILTEESLAAGVVTLMAIDVTVADQMVTESIATEVRAVLTRCIHAGQDLLLPSMSNGDPVDTVFIVAGADRRGSEIIATRIARELGRFDTTSKLNAVVSSTTVPVDHPGSTDERRAAVAARIEGLIQAHLQKKEHLT